MQISNPPTANDLIALDLEDARQQTLEELTERVPWASQFVGPTISLLNSDKVLRHYFNRVLRCSNADEDKLKHMLSVGAIALELAFGRPVAIRIILEFGAVPLLASSMVCVDTAGNYDTVDITCTLVSSIASFSDAMNGKSRIANIEYLRHHVPLTSSQLEIVTNAAREHDERCAETIQKLKH